jgi:hypothetical protein
VPLLPGSVAQRISQLILDHERVPREKEIPNRSVTLDPSLQNRVPRNNVFLQVLIEGMMAEKEITLCRVLLDRLCFKNDLDEAA